MKSKEKKIVYSDFVQPAHVYVKGAVGVFAPGPKRLIDTPLRIVIL